MTIRTNQIVFNFDSDSQIADTLGPQVRPLTKRRAEHVASTARRYAPIGKKKPRDRSGHRPGTLRKSIRVERARDTGGRFVAGYEVVANAPYAIFVHQGTVPHPIDGNPLLAFTASDGTFVVTPHVDHPGTVANPFLFEALQDTVEGSF